MRLAKVRMGQRCWFERLLRVEVGYEIWAVFDEYGYDTEARRRPTDPVGLAITFGYCGA